MITTSLCFLLSPSFITVGHVHTAVSPPPRLFLSAFYFPFRTNFLNIFMIAFCLFIDWIKFNFNFQPHNSILSFLFLLRLNVLCFSRGKVAFINQKCFFNFTTTKHFVFILFCYQRSLGGGGSSVVGWILTCWSVLESAERENLDPSFLEPGFVILLPRLMDLYLTMAKLSKCYLRKNQLLTWTHIIGLTLLTAHVEENKQNLNISGRSRSDGSKYTELQLESSLQI